eukprot:TRINITY_DN10648_c0_g1_i1.p1 TRINITY_DN10648_c0_g1~~TRINITY_DN10648_c0_g1_i1.p1  ORF type:complete len:354 (+),score=61.48 TRINITY_DN10648_c0_g1_i1:446-1507(+)
MKKGFQMGDDRFKPIDIFQLYSKLKMFEVKKEDVIVQEGKAGGYIYLIDGIILIEKTYTVKNMLNNIEHQGKVTLELGNNSPLVGVEILLDKMRKYCYTCEVYSKTAKAYKISHQDLYAKFPKDVIENIIKYHQKIQQVRKETYEKFIRNMIDKEIDEIKQNYRQSLFNNPDQAKNNSSSKNDQKDVSLTTTFYDTSKEITRPQTQNIHMQLQSRSNSTFHKQSRSTNYTRYSQSNCNNCSVNFTNNQENTSVPLSSQYNQMMNKLMTGLKKSIRQSKLAQFNQSSSKWDGHQELSKSFNEHFGNFQKMYNESFYDLKNCSPMKITSSSIQFSNKKHYNICLLYTSPSPRDQA